MTDILDSAEKKGSYSENEIFLEDATTVRTLRNIRNTLTKTLVNKGVIKDEDDNKELVEKILSVHGLSKSNFDFVSSMEKIISGKLNDNSIDDNSNKNEKSISGIGAETTAPVIKAIGYDYLYRMMVKLYGKKEAKRLSGEMYDFSLAISDSTKLLVPYCYSLDASKIVLQGRPFGQLPSKPPKRFVSYIAALNETIHQMSSHLAGACLYMDQNIIYKEDGILKSNKIKDIIDKFSLNKEYKNFQGNWNYSDDIKNLEVLENNGNFVKIKKVMKRNYLEDIYIIKTKSGKKIKVSKDHIFKVLFKGREIEVKAEDLKIYDTVFNTNFYDLPIDKNSKEYRDGQFYGILAGDGNLTQDYMIRVSINYDQTFISDFLDDYLEENKGKLLEGNKCYTYNIYSKKFIDSIKENFEGSTCYNKNINIEEKSLEFLVGFLDGIMVTDGYYNNSFGINLTNKNLITTIQKILEKININVDFRIIPEKDNRKESYFINIPIFVERYFSLMKEKTKKETKNKYFNDKDIAYFSKFSFSNSSLIYTGNNCKTYKKREREKYNPTTDVIISIEKNKNDDEFVYEIETETNWYSVGGILTHNCAIGTFFIDAAHLLMFKEKISLNDLQKDENRKYVENCFQSFVHSVNHLSRNGIESPFTNVSIFDRPKIKAVVSPDNMGWYFDDAFMPDNIKEELKEEPFENYIVEYIIGLQKIFTNFFDKGDPSNGGIPYRFPVVTYNFSKKKGEDGNFHIIDKKFLEDAVRNEIYRYNIYISEGTKIASCCRLINDSELMELAGQSNSFGGTSISLGSHRVITINFNKIALEAKTMKNYWEIIEQRVKDAALILKAHKELIKRLATGGLQPFISNGWIDMNKMFSTFGIVAVNEAEITLRQKFDIPKDVDVIKDFLSFFNERVGAISKENGIIGNIEQIPAESMAHRLVKADKLIFGEDNVPFNLYSNQFIPLYEEATLWERIEKDGKYNKLLTGGGIVHFNLGSPVTSEQAKSIINHAVESGSEHFALNSVYGKCENGHVTMGKNENCPICNEKIVDYYTRIIGYMTNVSSWNEIRRIFDFPNRKFRSVDEVKKDIVLEARTEKDVLKVLSGDIEHVVVKEEEAKSEKDLMRVMAGVV